MNQVYSTRIIAVTGGSGFIGRCIIDNLLDAGFKVRALQHHQPIGIADIEIIHGTLTDANSIQQLLKGADAVIHAGALVAAKREQNFHLVNAIGTQRLAAAAVSAGVPRLLLISSLAASRPELSPYAASKRAAEVMLKQQPGLAWDIIRPPAVYGTGDPHLLTLFKLLQRSIGLLPSGKDARASLLHVDDLAAAVTAWVRCDTALGQYHELDDRQPGDTTKHWQEIMQIAANLLQVQPRWIVPPRKVLLLIGGIIQLSARLAGATPFLTPGKVRELTAGDWVATRDERFRQQTGWRPVISTTQGLAALLAAYRQAGNLR